MIYVTKTERKKNSMALCPVMWLVMSQGSWNYRHLFTDRMTVSPHSHHLTFATFIDQMYFKRLMYNGYFLEETEQRTKNKGNTNYSNSLTYTVLWMQLNLWAKYWRALKNGFGRGWWMRHWSPPNPSRSSQDDVSSYHQPQNINQGSHMLRAIHHNLPPIIYRRGFQVLLTLPRQ